MSSMLVVMCDICCIYVLVMSALFFFFKQKTAYEMRISDWSSDVCSSDLAAAAAAPILLNIAMMTGILLVSDTQIVSARALAVAVAVRSEERRVGKEGVGTVRSRWSRFL